MKSIPKLTTANVYHPVINCALTQRTHPYARSKDFHRVVELMDTENLNRWLTLGANIAVFASIIFLAVEIQQNQVSIEEANRISRLDARYMEIEQFNDFRRTLFDDPDLLRIWTSGLADADLSPGDEARFDLLCANLVWISAGSWERSVALGRGDATAATTSIRAEMIAGSSRFANCWRDMREVLIPYGMGDYVRDVEELLGTRPDVAQ